ncbi:hypothetical protein V6917_21665 [Pectobacterium brasiliense]
MLGQQQHMGVIIHLQQLTADQRPLCQIERCPRFLFGQFCHASGAGRLVQLTQVMAGQAEADGIRINLLGGLPVEGGKAGAQAFVTGDQPVERARECRAVKSAGKAQRGRQVIGLTGGRIELCQEP